MEHAKYDPFGTQRDSQNMGSSVSRSRLGVHIGFTAHEHDDEFGLINMKGRIYDPQVGRFLSADPIISNPFFGQSYNRYSYVLNNPLAFTDPTGFQISDTHVFPETTIYGERAKSPTEGMTTGGGSPYGDTHTGSRPGYADSNGNHAVPDQATLMSNYLANKGSGSPYYRTAPSPENLGQFRDLPVNEQVKLLQSEGISGKPIEAPDDPAPRPLTPEELEEINIQLQITALEGYYRC